MELVTHHAPNWDKLCTGFGLPREDFGALSINEAIAAADRSAGLFERAAQGNIEHPAAQWALEYRNLSSLYQWFRDRMHFDTLAQALDAIDARQIDPGVVTVWVNDVFPLGVPEFLISTHMKIAYPEHKAQLEAFERARDIGYLVSIARFADSI